MMGLQGERPTTTDGKTLDPPRGHGLPVMSIGFLVDADQPMAWRGPMATQALTQMLADTRWGELDYLVVDMPPGTGDIQLTLTQRVPVSGRRHRHDAAGDRAPRRAQGPADVPQGRASRCSGSSRTWDCTAVPPAATSRTSSMRGRPRAGGAIRNDAARRAAARRKIREQADSGRPTVVADPASPAAQSFLAIARERRARSLRGESAAQVKMPTIRIEGE
jgi:ATP-binding protein involved in chromosome partitioning